MAIYTKKIISNLSLDRIAIVHIVLFSIIITNVSAIQSYIITILINFDSAWPYSSIL